MSNAQTFKFDNTVNVRVRSGSTGQVLADVTDHNDISDDLLASGAVVYGTAASPRCFLLKDGPAWSGFTWDRKNPWAPYMWLPNALYAGAVDSSADNHWKSASTTAFIGGRWKLFYQWTQLADDIYLKALGLTGWDSSIAANCYGLTTGGYSVITPQSLITLPEAILVRGRKGGSQVQDILEISYYLSVVGVN